MKESMLVNPARAGMIHRHSLIAFAISSKPRASGDDPRTAPSSITGMR